MIIVRLNGGLGNQLFQFAAGYALALKNADILKLDCSAFSKSTSKKTYRNPDILDFVGVAVFDLATPLEIQRIRNPYGDFSKFIRLLNQKLFKNYYHDWHPKVMSLKGNVYLDGYFQTEHYFHDIYDLLVKKLRLNDRLVENSNDTFSMIIGKKNSVSIHIRRGDYVSNPKAKALHDICTKDYFYKAIDYFDREIGDITLVVFSDDIAWVKDNLNWRSDTVFISDMLGRDGSHLSGPEELFLMSCCHHNIISNSTFSWWGAYLNQNKGKKVVAPILWNRSSLFTHENIIPDAWIRLPV